MKVYENRLHKKLFTDLTQLQRLHLNNNSITSIENATFEPMQSLKYLDLSNNRLQEVTAQTFSELLELEELHLTSNLIALIQPKALNNLKKLRILELSNNKILILHELVFQEGLPLRKINLMNCSIKEITPGTFRGLNNLNELILEGNSLKVSDVKNLDIPGLRVLKLSGNNLTGINGDSSLLDGLPSLQHLWMDFCNISDLPEGVFKKNKNLAKVDLSENRLTTLRDNFSNLTFLRELKLNENFLRELPELRVKSLEILGLSGNDFREANLSVMTLPKLKSLDLKDNSISGVDFSNATQLTTLDLSSNKLSLLPETFRIGSLRTLDLSWNNFDLLPGSLSEANLPALNFLNLRGNPMRNILEGSFPYGYHSSLEEIQITSSNLSVVNSKDLEPFPSLLHLRLEGNRIQRIEVGAFGGLHHLVTLDLGRNELSQLPEERLQGLGSLRVLNLTHNRLRLLEEFPEDLRSLQVLDLAFNQITRLQEEVFESLENLGELYLRGNWISSLIGDTFSSMKKLRVLDLSRNYLENVPLEAFKSLETQLRILSAEGKRLEFDLGG